jgi:hypothetical protein
MVVKAMLAPQPGARKRLLNNSNEIKLANRLRSSGRLIVLDSGVCNPTNSKSNGIHKRQAGATQRDKPFSLQGISKNDRAHR